MSLSLSKLEQLAPDQPSLNAAQKLLSPAKWPVLQRDAAGALLWGECQGSASAPYRSILALDDLAYKCSCPSRKLPCKHVLALGWLQAQSPAVFAVDQVPAWVGEWTLRRKPKAAKAGETEEERPRPSVAAAQEEAEPARDERDEARAAAQRERNQEAREAAIRAGLDELDQWIADQIWRGLARFQPVAQAQCRLAAQRLVDAKAPGLAARLDDLPSRLFAVPEHQRAEVLLEALGGLHLLAEAYRRQDRLPSALRADVRRLVGWAVSREALLADPAAPRISGRFMVAATTSEVQPDRLRRIETWLMRTDAVSDDPAFALLLDFVPLATGASASPFTPGEVLDATLVFYPSAAPLRALIAERRGETRSEELWPESLPPLAPALHDYGARLAEHPWLGSWPMAVRGVRVVEDDAETLWLVDEDDAAAVPLAADGRALATPLTWAGAIDAFGLWDGRRFELHLARTGLGRWQSH